MPERRANDAQVERLLHALKTDLSYRQDLAARITEKEGIKYASAMRRLQRYITEGAEKRSFARAPVEKRREVRADFREHERVTQTQTRQVERRLEREAIPLAGEFDEFEEEAEEGEFDTYEVHLNDLRSVLAFHDGDIKETARALGLTKRGEQLLSFQVQSDLADTSANVLEMQGGGAIEDAIREFLNDATPGTAQEIQDFADIFFNRPDWQIGVMLEDMRRGGTTFGEWMDAWVADDMDSQAENSEYWKVWRAAYVRTKA